MSNNANVFRPVKGSEERIQSMPITNGYVYFAIDTGHIYVDSDGQRRSVGGGQGASIYYATSTSIEKNEENYYVIYKENLDNSSAEYILGDIIINSDGNFYKITFIPEDNDEEIWCDLIAVSGNGGDGPSLTKKINVKINAPETTNLINGQSFTISVVATSAVDGSGVVQDDKLQITWSLNEKSDSGQYNLYHEKTIDADNGEQVDIEIGSLMRENATIKLMVYAYGINSGKSAVRSIDFTTATLTLEAAENFSNLNLFDTSNVSIQCNVRGNTEKLLYYYWDDELLDGEPVSLAANATTLQTKQVPVATHGMHKVRIELYQNVNGKNGLKAGELNYEIAVRGGANTPIIWTNGYKEKYYDYENIQILFQVYDPTKDTATVELYHGNKEVPGSPRNITRNAVDPKFEVWEITDASVGVRNTYSIICGEEGRQAKYDIAFEVEETNKLKLAQPENLVLKFDATGRSNGESATNRIKWSNPIEGKEKYIGSFKNFNWYNNGWISDSENQTCLKISNGASFSINFDPMKFSTGVEGENSWTIETQFKLSNLQNYQNLVTTYTRYKKDDDYWKEFEAQRNNPTGYDNYDDFLRYKGVADSLEFDKVIKEVNTTAAICNYFDGTRGFCLGPQDCFFTTGNETVNTNFVEDKMVYLAMVFSQSNQFVSIYLNGVLTGIVKNSVGPFTISKNIIEFNSKYCDVSLYKFRIYNTNLAINYIDLNLATDKRDIDIYNQTNLAKYNSSLNEYQFDYDAMLEYNKSYPDKAIMPYVVWTTTGTTAEENNLPYSKANVVSASMEFHNVALDRAYITGKLNDYATKDGLTDKDCLEKYGMTAVEYYYLHHCPSWHGDNIEMKVQGTSSEFYPRRNYKCKTKVAGPDGKKQPQMYMNWGPFEGKDRQTDWFYYDNYTVGTNKFTMKIDFMESSGTYNMGFANLVNNAYSKHPLDDYNKAGAFQVLDKESTTEQETTEYVEGTVYTYYNHKGNSKKTNDPEETDNIKITSKEDFDLGPYALYQKLMAQEPTVYTKLKVADEKSEKFNKWYIMVPGYKEYKVENTQDYRTSVQGFPVLAFHKRSDTGEVKYIGRYNMLLDKGSDEAYGFSLKDTVYQKFAGNKELDKVAECWEYSDNAGTYCSFRDPKGRNNLSFRTYKDTGEEELTEKGAPLVAGSFEYRYNNYGDELDIVYDLKSATSDKIQELKQSLKLDDLSETNLEPARKWMVDLMKNWEKACQWVWSTCTDGIPDLGTYTVIDLAEEKYDSNNVYYKRIVIADNKESYEQIAATEFDKDITYYKKEADDKYRVIKLTTDENLVYKPNIYYYKDSLVYYLATEDKFNIDRVYYTFEMSTGLTELPAPVTYDSVEYKYDTKEYRLAKFRAELAEHFDIEYVATYFVMTEVFECYDSRGKNCMMASWGPLKKGGEYIWYPIFYDIDTQLGINNTGIPSFTFDIDATIDGHFSTNNSVLWNNFYTCYKDSYILKKYRQLRGYTDSDTSQLGKVVNPPIQYVSNIESWYLADSEVCGRATTRTGEKRPFLAMKGEKPLIALNLDEYYKYITITNSKIAAGGGYIGQNGEWVAESIGGTPSDTYFYALQGDRSLSRQQFLSNRINYIDSWLKCGNFQRGQGVQTIWGRISANNPVEFPDKWVTKDSDKVKDSGCVVDEEYWVNGEKKHEFDAEYWVNLTASRTCYLSLGFDNDAIALEDSKSRGDSVRIFFPSTIETDLLQTPKKDEQLFYIYGGCQLADLGDMSKLYWSELHFDNTCPKLTRLLIGNDNFDCLKYNSDGAEVTNGYYRLDSQKIGLKEMPLLQEVCLSGVQTKDSGDLVYDFHTSEKLQSFRALRTNISSVQFAEGVALNTLYLPSVTKSLVLVEARQLTKLLKDYPVTRETEGSSNYLCREGLYIEGLFSDTPTTAINNIKLQNNALGYDSYNLIKQIVDINEGRTNKENITVTITGIDWCPYELIDEGTVYNEADSNLYYIRNSHYSFDKYIYTNLDDWKLSILNKELFKLNEERKAIGDELITDLSLIYDDKKSYGFSNGYYRSATETTLTNPTLEGIVYINNNTEIEESYVRNTLQKAYPNLEFYFNKVTKAYSAEFKQVEDDGTYKIIGTQKIANSDINTNWFTNPYTTYTPKKLDYDFIGWAKDKEGKEMLGTKNSEGQYVLSDEDWKDIKDIKNHDYIYYAIFEISKYLVSFLDGDGSLIEGKARPVAYGTEGIEPPKQIPYLDDSALDYEKTYVFKGYAVNPTTKKIINLEKQIITNDITYYPVFEEDSVYNNMHNEYFTILGNTINLNNEYKDLIRGRIAVPCSNSLTIIGDFTGSHSITDIYFANPENTAYTTISNSAFSGTTIKNIYFPSGIQTINSYAFQNCRQLISVGSLANQALRTLGISSFNHAESISINLNDAPNLIDLGGSSTFNYAGAGVIMDGLPKGVTSLSSYVFGDCPNVRIEDFTNVKTIGSSGALRSCGVNGNALNIVLPNDVSGYGDGCFRNYAVGNINTVSYQGGGSVDDETLSRLGLSYSNPQTIEMIY